VRTFGPLSVVSALLLAADPSWKGKDMSTWSAEEAKQILADSPWSKTIKAGITRLQTEEQRRESGFMGQGHGVGYDGLETPRPKFPSLPSLFGIGKVETRPAPQTLTLLLRWESALPVRVAGLKANVPPPPALDRDGYTIAVYGVPHANVDDDPKSLGKPLKKQAFLRRTGKKDVKPSGAQVFQGENGTVVLYTFPPSAEINKNDGHIDFNAQIGRIVFTQSFDLTEMQIQGKLEL